MPTAFVLSGGASLGAVQVGMLAALTEAGIEPDLVVGSSVGAVNGAWIAGWPGADGVAALADLWRSLRRGLVFPTQPLRTMLGVLGRRDHLVADAGLRALLVEHMRFTRLEDAPVPLHVIATDLLAGTDVCLSTGPAVPAILASAAIPSVFPPVEIDGRALVDGAVVNNTPLSHAVRLGADEIWVMSTGNACALPATPMGAVAVAIQALTVAINQRLAADVERYAPVARLHVVPPLCPVRTSPVDFSQAAGLIDGAHAATVTWLRTGAPVAEHARELWTHPHEAGEPA